MLPVTVSWFQTSVLVVKLHVYPQLGFTCATRAYE